jgi:hypothetical protein
MGQNLDSELQEVLEKTEKRLSQVETELAMSNYLNGWLIKSYEEEAKVLRERIKIIKCE